MTGLLIVAMEEPALKGRLIDASGRPVAAQVCYMVGLQPHCEVVASAQTDAGGRFTFVNPPLRRNGVPHYLLAVTSNGFPVPLGRYWFAEKETYRLPAASSLRVQILDRADKPIAGMKVSIESLTLQSPELATGPVPIGLRKGLARTTDPKGFVTFPSLPIGSVVLTSADPRYAFRVPRMIFVGPGSSVAPPLYVEPAATLTGRVVLDEGKRPVAGIPFMVSHFIWGRPVSGVTDATGRYRLSGLPAGAYRVELGRKADPNLIAVAGERVVVLPGATGKAPDLRINPAVFVMGQISGVPSGKPLVNVNVRLWRPGDVDPIMAFTDEEGRYAIPTRPGAQKISVFFDTEQALKVGTNGADLDLTIRDPIPFALPAPKPPRLVRVVTAEGRPAPGAEVVLESDFGQSPIYPTDAEGVARLPYYLRPPIVVRARRAGDATAKATVILDQPSVTLTLQAKVNASLTGVVHRSSGTPLSGAVATLYEQGEGVGTSVATVLTDAEGRWRFDGLWPDADYLVDVQAAGYRSAMTPKRIRPALGKATVVSLPPLGVADGKVAGRVVDHLGNPVAGVEVTAGVGAAWALTGIDGRFRLDRLDPDRIELVARFSHGREASKTLRSSASDVVLVLPSKPRTMGEGVDITNHLVGKAAPELRPGIWMDGQARNRESLQGKVVVLDFWGIGCGPCVGALPSVQRMWETFKDRGVVVIGVHDSSVRREDLTRFMKLHGLTYPMAIDAEVTNGFGRTFIDYSVSAMPRIVVVGRDGKIAHVSGSVSDVMDRLAQMVVEGK